MGKLPPVTPLQAVVATMLFLAMAPSAAVRAQSPVQIGAPLTGEVVLNRDVEVRISPSENGRIVMTLEKGKPLNALGTPRGTLWTQVAIGGQPIGYVPADALDPALAIRPLPLPSPPLRDAGVVRGDVAILPSGTRAAVVPKEAWDRAQNARAQGYVATLEDIPAPPPPPEPDPKKAAKKKKDEPTGPLLRRGEAAGVLAVDAHGVEIIAPGNKQAVVPATKLVGVLTGYPLAGQMPLGTGALYAAQIGEYIDYAEGRRAWDVFIRGAGGDFRGRPPMVWPVFRGGGQVVYQMGIGPFSATELDNVCPLLARRGYPCSIIDLARF